MNISKIGVESMSLEHDDDDDDDDEDFFKTLFQQHTFCVQEYRVNKQQYLENQESTASFLDLQKGTRLQGR
jgi:hypothetical protein